MAQHSEVFASKLEDASPAAIFRTELKLHCSIVLYAKPCGKRPLLSPEKSLEGTLYSVPSFGGHIAISHDVTTYPFLAMARTASGQDKASCPLGTTRCIQQAKLPQKSYSKSFIDQVCSVKMAGYWPCSFFASLWTSTSSPSLNTQKKNLANIQSS